MVRYTKNLPPGAVALYGQGGGCAGPYGTAGQNGGFAWLPALTGAYAALKKYQPFTKANNALRDNFGQHKDSTLYKVADKVTGIGKSLGLGPVGMYQPNLMMKKPRAKKSGAGRPKRVGRPRKAKK